VEGRRSSRRNARSQRKERPCHGEVYFESCLFNGRDRCTKGKRDDHQPDPVHRPSSSLDRESTFFPPVRLRHVARLLVSSLEKKENPPERKRERERERERGGGRAEQYPRFLSDYVHAGCTAKRRSVLRSVLIIFKDLRSTMSRVIVFH
jgi:hypothetical protein